MIISFSTAEMTSYLYEIDEPSPIVVCDEQYNECAEKCEESLPNVCVEQCQQIADQCYHTVLSETDDEKDSE